MGWNWKGSSVVRGWSRRVYRQVRRIAGENREEILDRYPRIMRRVSGYNLDEFPGWGQPGSLQHGAYGGGVRGTLCVVTEVKVNLVPLPSKKALAVLHFQDMVRACEATWEILGHQPAAVELIGRMILDRCRASLGFSRLMGFVEGSRTPSWWWSSAVTRRRRWWGGCRRSRMTWPGRVWATPA